MSSRRTTTTVIPTGRPARMPGHERREHLLDVAALAIVEEGIDAVTMEGIAARAGVSKGLGYAYFRNRDELVVALYDREMRSLDERVMKAIAAEATLEAKVRATLTVWFAHLYERGEIIATLAMAQPAEGPVADRRRARQHALERFWTELVIEEYPNVPKHLARAMAAAALSGAGGLVESWVRRKASRSELIPAYTAFVVEGMRACDELYR
jgi:AcrR family transcriptional regulator